MNLSIVSAKYVAPLKVELHFNDDTVKTIDVGAFIKKHPHPQYNSYLNEKKFKKFKIEFGNIVWGKNWDLIFPIDMLAFAAEQKAPGAIRIGGFFRFSLQVNRSRTFKWINMALKIKTREEAIAVLRDMVKRKREMEAKAQIDFAKARKEAANCYASL